MAAVDGDDGRVAAAAQALDDAERHLAVLGRLAGADAELGLERADDPCATSAHEVRADLHSCSPTGSRWNMS